MPQYVLAMAETDIDHIVMGSRGRSPLTRPYLGHVSEAVVRCAPVSTTVVPETAGAIRDRDLPGKVLVPLDGSEQAEAALEYAFETFPDGKHTVFHALSLPFDQPRSAVTGSSLEDVLDAREDRAETVFEAETTLADEYGQSIETETGPGSPANAIVEYAATNEYDQIIMGSHGRSLQTHLSTGSVAKRVSHRSTRSVTLVRGAPAD